MLTAALLLAASFIGADFEIECPDVTHPGLVIISAPVPAECPHKNGPCKATVYDYMTKPPAFKDGKPNPEQPKTLHMIKSVSPCGCVVKHELCACVPNGEYPGTCEASYSNDKAKQLGKFDQSVCTYAIKVPLEKACCPAGGPCPKP